MNMLIRLWAIYENYYLLHKQINTNPPVHVKTKVQKAKFSWYRGTVSTASLASYTETCVFKFKYRMKGTWNYICGFKYMQDNFGCGDMLR